MFDHKELSYIEVGAAVEGGLFVLRTGVLWEFNPGPKTINDGQKERAIEIALASRFCDHSKLKI